MVILNQRAIVKTKTKNMLQHYYRVVMTSLGAKQVVAQVVAALLVNRIVPAEEPDDVERQSLNLFPIWVRVIPVSKD